MKILIIFQIFIFSDIKLDLKIDGKQHNYKERKESDKKRDKLLIEKLGINVYRIKWKSINNKKGKEYIKKEIEKFLIYYNKLK